jgi:cyclopropane-fatty-acyl-phospholipid synthase
VLDIGSGWGGLALYLARTAGVGDVLGVTLSEEQIAAPGAAPRRLAWARRVRFNLTDYRAVEGRFDRIVSVGMFEHVGLGNYETFFKPAASGLPTTASCCCIRLACSDRAQPHNPWVTRYIFPGGHLPSLSDISRRSSAAA